DTPRPSRGRRPVPREPVELRWSGATVHYHAWWCQWYESGIQDTLHNRDNSVIRQEHSLLSLLKTDLFPLNGSYFHSMEIGQEVIQRMRSGVDEVTSGDRGGGGRDGRNTCRMRGPGDEHVVGYRGESVVGAREGRRRPDHRQRDRDRRTEPGHQVDGHGPEPVQPDVGRAGDAGPERQARARPGHL